MNHEPKVPADAWEVLSPTLSSQRCQRMQQIAGQRTHHVRLVIQDIHNPHNISACLRSAEAFGISRVDIVNTRAFFKVSTASSGVGSWLELRVHTSIAACIAELKSQGYVLMLGMPNLDAKPLQQLEVDRPIAVIFGNEHSGVSPEWFNGIDGTFTVPMVGFVESLNISVCAAITLEHLSSRARASLPADHYFIGPAHQKTLLNQWAWNQRPSAAAEYKRLKAPLTAR